MFAGIAPRVARRAVVSQLGRGWPHRLSSVQPVALSGLHSSHYWIDSSSLRRQFTAGGNHDEVQNAVDSHDVVVFYSPTCPFCAQAIDALSQAKIEHKLVMINAEYKAGLIGRIQKGSVPSVWVKGEYIGGCNDGIKPGQGVLPMLQSGKLQEMLRS
mmetsp:Transcript_36995/g.85379  ORF Transcript_36995/g.85379 Transcript_36995/m.85379 type:complete len:157 (+) Transcript_36995:67-537(+)